MTDDRHYRVWMNGAALAVLMFIVMFWIRSQIPDDSSVVTPVQAAAAADVTVVAPMPADFAVDVHEPVQQPLASVNK